MLDKIFSQILVINLDRRKDRWERISAHLQSLGVEKFQRISAVDGLAEPSDLCRKVACRKNEQDLEQPSLRQRGIIGCLKSHEKALQIAALDPDGMVLILEDDCFFVENTMAILSESLKELPKDWQFFMLGARYRKAPDFISGLRRIVRIKKASATHAYVVHAKSAILALDHIQRVLSSPTVVAVDVLYMTVQSKEAWYGIHPFLAGQYSDWSDIEGANRIHTNESFSVGIEMTRKKWLWMTFLALLGFKFNPK